MRQRTCLKIQGEIRCDDYTVKRSALSTYTYLALKAYFTLMQVIPTCGEFPWATRSLDPSSSVWSTVRESYLRPFPRPPKSTTRATLGVRVRVHLTLSQAHSKPFNGPQCGELRGHYRPCLAPFPLQISTLTVGPSSLNPTRSAPSTLHSLTKPSPRILRP